MPERVAPAGAVRAADARARPRPHLPGGDPQRAGAVPVIIPPLDTDSIEPLLDGLCGLCLSGGPDLHPGAYGDDAAPRARPDRAAPRPRSRSRSCARPRRATCRCSRSAAACRCSTSRAAARWCRTCRASARRTSSIASSAPRRIPTHDVTLEREQPRSPARSASPRSRVNSFHHQAVDRLGDGLRAVGWATDGVIEAVEATDRAFIVARAVARREHGPTRPSRRACCAAFARGRRWPTGGSRACRLTPGRRSPVRLVEVALMATTYTLGVEEEVMLLDPRGWSARAADRRRARRAARRAARPRQLRDALRGGRAARPACTRPSATRSPSSGTLRDDSSAPCSTALGLAAGVAGTHPVGGLARDGGLARASAIRRSTARCASSRAASRRSRCTCTSALPSGRRASRAFNRLRAHLPILLALSANSPFWQGRDTGLASARTPLFQAFPRVGHPARVRSYGEYVRAVNLLLRLRRVPRPHLPVVGRAPAAALRHRRGADHGRAVDARPRRRALVALVQSLARLELVDGHADAALVHAPEVLDENRFLAARDGVDAALRRPRARRSGVGRRARRPVMVVLRAARAGARLRGRARSTSPSCSSTAADGRQRRLAERDGLVGLVEALADEFLAAPAPDPA